MFKGTLYLIALLLSSGPTSAENRVWQACDEDSECGPNEVCQKATSLNKPCSRGLCACRPCFDIYSWSDICTKPIFRALYDKCDMEEPRGVIYPPNSYCSRSGIVECVEGWQDSNSDNYEDSCVESRTLRQKPEDEQPCYKNSQCFGDLVCSNMFKCSCYFGHEKWDRQKRRCVKKDYGDRCQIDSDCEVSGHNWQGYTYSHGACANGYCACSENGKPAVVSFFEPGSSALKVKTICIDAGANSNISHGEWCTLDPIYNGDTPVARVCPAQFVCYQCPEQYLSGELPICRIALPSSQPNIQNCYPSRRNRPPTTTAIGQIKLDTSFTRSHAISTLLRGRSNFGDEEIVTLVDDGTRTSPSYKVSDDDTQNTNNGLPLVHIVTSLYLMLFFLPLAVYTGVLT